MLNDLKFVAGAVSRKDFVQALSHFRIENGTVRGFNGTIGLCSPIDLDLDITPNATQFIRAVQACEETIGLHVTPAGKLSLKSGKFKALIECIEKENFPEITPQGEFVAVQPGFLDTIRRLSTFISDDASRNWSRGILFKGQSAFATNNIVLAESWLGYDFPVTVNIPKTAIIELLRINEEPISLQMTENRISFHFEGGRWLCSQTYETAWPDLSRVLNTTSNPVPTPINLFEDIETLQPFTNDVNALFFTQGLIATSETADTGASIENKNIDFTGKYDVRHLLLLRDIATSVDFSLYPAPCMFFGDKIRGAIVGMRQ